MALSNVPGVAVLAFLVAFFPLSAKAQELLYLDENAFSENRRPPSRFGHELHMQMIPDCTRCHHVYEDGQKIQGADSVGMPCSECHPVEPGNQVVTPLRNAYHRQCKGCHLEEKSGPVGCGQCHVREAD